MAEPLLVARAAGGGKDALLLPRMANRHGLIAGDQGRVIAASVLAGHYENAVDRESAYELLKVRAEAAAVETPAPKRASGRQGLVEAMAKSAVRTIGSQIGRQIVRGVLGSLLRR